MLADKLRARIRADGPMPFEEYMAACLYDPEFGFFTSGPLRSVKEGDFLTSPEVSPWFGRMVARFVAQEQEHTGADPFLVVEAAAGSGSLLRPLMEELGSLPHAVGEMPGRAEGVEGGSSSQADHVPRIEGGLQSMSPRSEAAAGSVRFEAQEIERGLPHVVGEMPGRAEGDDAEGERVDGGLPHAVGETRRSAGDDAEGAERGSPRYKFNAIEASPAAREALTDLLAPDNVHASLVHLPETFDGVIVVNELLDNLPCALAIRSGDGWVERWVGATEDRFGFVTAEARSEVIEWCDAHAGNVPEGGMVEVQIQATEWIISALSRVDRGALLLFDYGGTAEELESRRTQGTLRTYRRHHLGPGPLLEPGATDVTVDVNFTAMLAAAESAGATVTLRRQDDFLAGLGLRDVVRCLRHRERDLAAAGDAMQRLVVRSEATDAETLLHPRGLGDFRVVVVRRDGDTPMPRPH